MFAHAGETVSRQVPQNNRRRDLLTLPPLAAEQLSSRWNTLRAHGATNKSHHVCARRRDVRRQGLSGPRTKQMPVHRLSQ